MLKGTEINTIKWEEEIMDKVPTRRPVHCHQDFSCRPIFQCPPVLFQALPPHCSMSHSPRNSAVAEEPAVVARQFWWLWPPDHPEIFTGCSDLGKTCWYAVIFSIVPWCSFLLLKWVYTTVLLLSFLAFRIHAQNLCWESGLVFPYRNKTHSFLWECC